jgi:hypothetical protein
MISLKKPVIFFLFIVNLVCSAQKNKSDTTQFPLGLYFNETYLDVHTSMGYRMFELRKGSVVLLWENDQGSMVWSELGVWTLKGDTVRMVFDRSQWSFIWRKGPDKEPNFYSSLEMLVAPWIYRRVGKEIFSQKQFVRKFAIEGKAVYNDGHPVVRTKLSPGTCIRMDQLSKWDKEYDNKNVEVQGVLEVDSEGSFILKDWQVSLRE